MASICRRKSDNVVNYVFSNLTDINNLNLNAENFTYTIVGGHEQGYVDQSINTSTHELIHDVTPPTKFWGNCFTYIDGNWSILTDVVTNMNNTRKAMRDKEGTDYPADIEVEI